MVNEEKCLRLGFLRRFRRVAFPIFKKRSNRSYGEISESGS